ncbi:MAG TPA: IS481 family transposase [Buttiauxella sp.]|jgi:transposase InsO family protein
MAWKTMDVHEQRVRFVVEATQKTRTFRALCAAYGISRPTGYLWLQRYRELGVEGIAERSRKPHRSPERTDPERERQVVQLRQRYPDWGARKLKVLLARQGVELPRNTIHRILLRHDLVRDLDRRDAATQRFERGEPNELWQMDFKGPKGWPQTVGPLSVLDDHSRYLIALAANGSTHGEAVREQLEEAFQRCGVPEGMLMDHGTPWWSQQSPSGQTHLSLWLMRQGIRLHWSGIRHPQTQGKVERFHGALQRALQRRGVPPDKRQAWLDAYRWEHNHVRPHEALGMQTPATLWRPSLRRYDPHPPRWEYPAGAWVLKLDCYGQLDIRNQKWKVSKALAGERVQVVPLEGRMMVFYCTTLLRELDPGIQRSKIVERWIPRPSSSPPTVKDV